MLLFSFAVYSLFRKPISKMHAKIYGLKEEEIPAMVYKLMAFYKVLIIVFCFVPYLALLIIGR